MVCGTPGHRHPRSTRRSGRNLLKNKRKLREAKDTYDDRARRLYQIGKRPHLTGDFGPDNDDNDPKKMVLNYFVQSYADDIPHGDLTIVIDNGPADCSRAYRVCSQTMTNASPFFKKNIEGDLDVGDDGLKQIVIKEPNPAAFRYIVHVLHTTMHGHIGLEPPQGKDLYQIALTASRHDLSPGLFFARQWWFQAGFVTRSNHPMPQWYLLWSAFYFEDHRWFFKISGSLIRRERVTFPKGVLWESFDLPMRKMHTAVEQAKVLRHDGYATRKDVGICLKCFKRDFEAGATFFLAHDDLSQCSGQTEIREDSSMDYTII